MTIASCGSVSATTLGLPNSTAIPAEKARLPKGLFVAKIPVSAKTKQRLANDIESITMLSLLQARNIGLAAGTRVPEILVIGLRLHEPNAAVPTDIVELIAMQRKSGMLFVCVRDDDIEGTTRQESAFAVRRPVFRRADRCIIRVFAEELQRVCEISVCQRVALDRAIDRAVGRAGGLTVGLPCKLQIEVNAAFQPQHERKVNVRLHGFTLLVLLYGMGLHGQDIVLKLCTVRQRHVQHTARIRILRYAVARSDLHTGDLRVACVESGEINVIAQDMTD